MEARRFETLAITSAVVPDASYLWIEINSAGSFYTVATGSTDHLWYSSDKMENNAKIDVDPGDAWGGDNDHRPTIIRSAWHDVSNKIIYFVDHATGNIIYVWKLDYSASESSPTITELSTITNNVVAVVSTDIFLIGSDLFVWWSDASEIAVEKWVDPNWVNQDSFASATLNILFRAIVIGTTVYTIYDDAANDDAIMLIYDNGIPSIAALATLADTSLTAIPGTMTYDGNNIISFVAKNDGTGLNTLHDYSISGNSYTTRSAYHIEFQLDRNNQGNVPSELEKAWGLSTNDEVVYEIKPRKGGIVILQDISDATSSAIRSITDNFLIRLGGQMWEWTDVSSKIERIRINDGILPRRKIATMTIHPDNETIWNRGDSIKVYDDSDVLCFWGKIITKDRNNKGLYFYNMDSYANELFKVTYVKVYSSDKTSEKLQDIIDNACDFCYRDSSIVATATDYSYTFKRSIIYMFHLARFLEREVCYVEPDGKVITKAYNSLTATGESWNLNATTNNIVLVDIPGVQEAQRGYYVADVGVTRATVRYQNNATSTKPVAGTRDPIEQVKGITPLKEFRDAKLEAATEADQLATNLYDIFSSISEYIGMKVNGEGWQQPGETIQLQNTGVITITQDNFLILSVIYDPKNDTYERMILSDNMVFSKELNSFLDTSGTQIHAGHLQSIENQADISAQAWINDSITVGNTTSASSEDALAEALGIGSGNARWITGAIAGSSSATTYAYRNTPHISNLGGTNYSLTFDIPLPFQIVIAGTTYNLTITKNRIGIMVSDADDFVDITRFYGWTTANPPVLSAALAQIDHDVVHGKTSGLYTNDNSDITVGGVYNRFAYYVVVTATTAAQIQIGLIQFEYYYAAA